MLGYVKHLLRRWVEAPDQEQSAPTASAAAATGRKIVTVPGPAAAPAPRTSRAHNGSGIELPLQPILAGLPLELQPRLRNPDAGGRTVCIPLEKILAQLSRGTVKISFGELRQAALDLFSPETDRDGVMVPLPLGDVLPRLNPALITRRRAQKKVEVPADISSPFDQRNQALIFSVGPTKPSSAPAAHAPSRQTAVPKPTVPPGRGGLTFAPKSPPPGSNIATTGAAVPKPAAPALPLRDPDLKRPPVSQPPSSPAPTPAPTPAPAPAPAPAPIPAPAPVPVVAAAPTPAAPPPPAPKPPGEAEPLMVGLISLAEGWPEAVRQELVQANLVDAKVALPAEMIERALKQGRIAFTWKTLRSWIRPVPTLAVSAHDNTVLELPLKVVAPPFLARQKEAGKLQKKVVVDDEIPNLFFGFPQPETASPRVAAATSPTAPKPADTNYYVWDDTSDRARIQDDEVKRGPSAGTRFVAKYATPNEIVSRAAALDGVAGSLIALPDGLMVASRLPSDLNGDTLAAFLPQIFGKINQCTKELRMGELNNVNFTVGNIPWKIFRVNSIFFAAFGRAREPLPTAQLAALAAELDHKPK